VSQTRERRRGAGQAHRDAAQGHRQGSTPRKRAMRPRAPIALLAAYVSQLNCLPLLGINDRRFLDAVVPKCVGHITALGKLRFVPLDVAVEKLGELAVAGSNPAVDVDETEDDDQPQTAAEVRARMGRELVP
jgi:hypothetical protein